MENTRELILESIRNNDPARLATLLSSYTNIDEQDAEVCYYVD
jgi:hypothetical protein